MLSQFNGPDNPSKLLPSIKLTFYKKFRFKKSFKCHGFFGWYQLYFPPCVNDIDFVINTQVHVHILWRNPKLPTYQPLFLYFQIIIIMEEKRNQSTNSLTANTRTAQYTKRSRKKLLLRKRVIFHNSKCVHQSSHHGYLHQNNESVLWNGIIEEKDVQSKSCFDKVETQE
jgi:hypothetical protein